MKGILSLNEDNQYILFDKEKTESYNLTELINIHRKDKVTFSLITSTNSIHKIGYIASKRAYNKLYDDCIVNIPIYPEKQDIDDSTWDDVIDITEILFKNVDKHIKFNMQKINTESEDAK